MLRTVANRRNAYLRRVAICTCSVALLALMPVGASAEHKSDHADFTGTALSLTPNDETGSKKKKKQVAAKSLESKHAKAVPQIAKQEVAQIEPPQQMYKIDSGQTFKFDPDQQVLKIVPEKQQVFRVDPKQRVIIQPAASVPGVDVVDGVQVPKDVSDSAAAAAVEPDNVPGDLVEAQSDPFEGLNRVVFGFNVVVDHLVFEPAARIYRAVIPSPVRIGVANVLNNLATPVTLANDILQGNPEAAANTIKRFMINSSLGIGGIFDHATGLGEPLHHEDFGQTLGVWGVNGNPYIVLPILGPSNPRDMVGKVADAAVDPMTWVLYDAPLWQRAILPGTEAVSAREQILDDYDTLRKNSPDLYASVRDLYAEKRQSEIANDAAAGNGPGVRVSTLPRSIPPTLNPY